MMEEILRILAAFMIGFILSSSGSFAQLLTQNPLASASTLGIQALALLALILGFVIEAMFNVGDYIFIGLIVFLVFATTFFWLAFGQKRVETSFFNKLIIYGIGINLLIGAIYSLLQFVLMNMGVQFPSELWFGSLKFVDLREFIILFIVFLIFFLLSLFKSKELRLFMIGRDFALSFKHDFVFLEKKIFFLMLICVGVVTVLFGVFSFVGLIFPHLLRSFGFFKKDIFHEVFYGGLLSGVVFLILDQICYHFPVSGAEIPVGMVISVLGPLIFLKVYLKSKASINSIY